MSGYSYCRVHGFGRISKTPWYQNLLWQLFIGIVFPILLGYIFFVKGPSTEGQDAILGEVKEIRQTTSQLGQKLDDEGKNRMLVRGLAEAATDATWISNTTTNVAIKQLATKLQGLLDSFLATHGTNYPPEVAFDIKIAKATAARARGEYHDVLTIINEDDEDAAERRMSSGLKVLELRAGAQEALFKFDEVFRICEKILKFQPTHINALLSSGGALNQLGRHAEATNRLTILLNQLRKFDTKTTHPLVPILGFHERGNAYVQLGLTEEALSDYQNGLRLSSLVVPKGFPELTFTLAGGSNNVGMILRKLNRYPDAITNFTTSIGTLRHSIRDDKIPGLPLLLSSVLRNRGAAYLETQQYAIATNDYNEALFILRGLTNLVKSELDSRIADTFLHRSAAYNELGLLKEAMDDATEAVNLFTPLAKPENTLIRPDLAKAMVQKGMVCLKLNNPLQAISEATNALTIYQQLVQQGIPHLNIEIADAHRVHGLGLFLLGEFGKASNEFTLSIERYSDRVKNGDLRFERGLPKLYENRAQCHIQQKNCPNAISDCTKALDIRRRLKTRDETDDAAISLTLWWRATFYRACNFMNEATLDYREIVKLSALESAVIEARAFLQGMQKQP